VQHWGRLDILVNGLDKPFAAPFLDITGPQEDQILALYESSVDTSKNGVSPGFPKCAGPSMQNELDSNCWDTMVMDKGKCYTSSSMV